MLQFSLQGRDEFTGADIKVPVEIEAPREVASLEERLRMGCDPDQEFYHRLERCATAFIADPMLRIAFLPKLRAASEAADLVGMGFGNLWKIAEPELNPQARRSSDRSIQPAPTTPTAKPAPTPAPTTKKKVLRTVVTKRGVTHQKRA